LEHCNRMHRIPGKKFPVSQDVSTMVEEIKFINFLNQSDLAHIGVKVTMPTLG
jgi:hypothetical protein